MAVTKMEVDENHSRNCMVFLFRQGMHAIEATRSLCVNYGDVLKVNKCQRWLGKFTSGNIKLIFLSVNAPEGNMSLTESDSRQNVN